MEKITSFLNKNGMLILVIIGLITMLGTCSSCGGKGEAERANRRLDKIEKTLEKMDTTIDEKVSNEKLSILLEINALEISREVVYSNNAVVRTTARPDDLINQYNNKIKELQNKLKDVK
jgi:predicted translin family RNA/ssDNA-binding protein